jgi:hypothetical protein
VIMSGGTNPDHPWRMPDYAFYQELLQYAGSAGWVRPGQGDWHARLEEYEWCRDGRWVVRLGSNLGQTWVGRLWFVYI